MCHSSASRNPSLQLSRCSWLLFFAICRFPLGSGLEATGLQSPSIPSSRACSRPSTLFSDSQPRGLCIWLSFSSVPPPTGLLRAPSTQPRPLVHSVDNRTMLGQSVVDTIRSRNFSCFPRLGSKAGSFPRRAACDFACCSLYWHGWCHHWTSNCSYGWIGLNYL